MFRIKRLYIFMLQSFLPLFLMTFGICLFIVLMQFLWKYIDDMVGKGLDMAVLAEMFFYAALSLVPMALPLAVLLASLMTFGNLGERLELLAMKAAGVSLFRIMRPLVITLCFISVGAFFFQNNALPYAQVKLYTLLYSVRQKSPELDIPEKVFNSDVPGYSIYVQQKERDGLLKDIMIYDYSGGFNNARVIVADSGRLKTSADKLFLVLSLFEGESFENANKEQGTAKIKEAVPYRRETFTTKDILIEFDANFSRTDESFFQTQYIGKDLKDLETSIDSMTYRLDSIRSLNSRGIYESSYRKTIRKPNNPVREVVEQQDSTEQKKRRMFAKESNTAPEPTIVLSYDSIYTELEPGNKAAVLNRAKSSVENVRTEYLFKAHAVGDEMNKYRRHIIEWHKKFTIPFACMVFFFIGAPLGAIIRKGGLGMPVVISVFLFIFYYIVDTFGIKMARDGIWPAWQGVWLSTAVLTPLGAFLTYKAVNDSVILNADTYLNGLKKLIGRRAERKIERKEVIIFYPDYTSTLSALEKLMEECQVYLKGHKRWLNYFTFWKQGGKDHSAEHIADDMERIVEELSNSDQILILNKLMDYPIIGGYNQSKINFKGKTGFITGLFFPIGLPIYFIATYQRKLLRQDMHTIRKVSDELYSIIEEMTKQEAI